MDFGKRGNLIYVEDVACDLLGVEPRATPVQPLRSPKTVVQNAWVGTHGVVRDESCAGGIFEPAVLGFKIPRSVLSRILRFLRFGNTWRPRRPRRCSAAGPTACRRPASERWQGA
jgi:hypothetical protein